MFKAQFQLAWTAAVVNARPAMTGVPTEAAELKCCRKWDIYIKWPPVESFSVAYMLLHWDSLAEHRERIHCSVMMFSSCKRCLYLLAICCLILLLASNYCNKSGSPVFQQAPFIAHPLSGAWSVSSKDEKKTHTLTRERSAQGTSGVCSSSEKLWHEVQEQFRAVSQTIMAHDRTWFIVKNVLPPHQGPSASFLLAKGCWRAFIPRTGIWETVTIQIK